jgi:hypothetical protein
MFGALLPLAAIVIELATRMCSEVFFNPLPSAVHVLVAATVPASAFAVGLRARWPARLLAWLNASALVVSALYAIPFVPLVPLGLLTAPVLIGLLPLAPFFALWTAIRQRRRLVREMAAPSLWRMAAVMLLLITIASTPRLVSRGALHWTMQHPEDMARAVRTVRHFGSEYALLEAAQSRGGSVMEAFTERVPEGHAREFYYRVTGRDSRSEPRAVEGVRWFDPNQGSSTVGAVLPGLNLASSQMDGSVDAAGGVAYTEWTMVFRNADAMQREARATVQLPRGGVVSRVTLWIDGEPREAAIGGRAQTTAAYRAVVAARRDPLLVTTAGPDRVLVQCFPVPPNGEMKIRIGVTAPVEEGGLALPFFQEQNFVVPETHLVWIEGGKQSVRRAVAHRDLHKPFEGWRSERPAEVAWTPDPESKAHHVVQRMIGQPRRRYDKLIYVVDGSAAMRPYAEALARQLRGEVILASDAVRVVERLTPGDFAGGADNAAALVEAQARAAGEPDAAIVWIHGPQRVAMTSADGLKQFWARRPGAVPLYSMQLEPGPDEVMAALDGVREVRVLVPDVERVAERFAGGGVELVAVRERFAGAGPAGAHRTSAHLARLWAHEESIRTGDRELAARYRLVTPLTGAVVLESAAQYKAAGLTAAMPGTVPTVPEPETWALMIVGFGAILAQMWRVRRGSQKGEAAS